MLGQNYDFELWARHESPWRYVRHFQNIFKSRVLCELKWIIAAVAAVAAAICAGYTYGPVSDHGPPCNGIAAGLDGSCRKLSEVVVPPLSDGANPIGRGTHPPSCAS